MKQYKRPNIFVIALSPDEIRTDLISSSSYHDSDDAQNPMSDSFDKIFKS